MLNTDGATPGALLRKPVSGWLPAQAHLRGFGGFHGGLALALLTSAMREHAPGLELQSVTGRFDRPVDPGFGVDSSLVRAGRTLTVVRAAAQGEKGTAIEASAVFARRGEDAWQAVTPPPPAAPRPEECEVFAIPPEFVPIATSMEIRPVGPARPYAGGPVPELIAWVRLVEDDEAPDVLRLVLLMDALAPSYAAVLSTLAVVPTVELTVRPGPGLAGASSRWILLRATTRAAGPDGWVDEQIDAWGADGTHLGSAHQLRVVRAV
ncbi:thioesterase family protein [Streptomyces sp. NPDC048106]|uniref:thioesterase family protein n=1 Tax=Streptomyces sp. NPDC048106 TaxID=3155750 RepID=UPI003457036F